MSAELTYEQFLNSVNAFAQQVVVNADAINRWAEFIDRESTDTAHIADLIGAKNVDRDTTAETHQLSRIMRDVSEDAIQYAARANTTSRIAHNSRQQAVDSHQGIHEHVNASPVEGIHDVHNDWFTQE
ncbi:hypothetical protein ACIQVL_48935 [Streptomyces sp. NPDC090499]|uniref:hypothetical protein n=1 Tax=Streptomyces sp. NPDC090499 TaxID=3365965 RepID=UPI00381A05D1